MQQLRPTDLLNIDRELASRSLAAFTEMAWHVIEPSEPYVHGWHIDALSEHLEAIASEDVTRLLINVPPGMMKSSMVAVFFPAWLWGPSGKPWYRFLAAAHEQGLATRDNRRTRLLVESDWYQKRWPVNIVSDQNEKKYFENEARGFRQSSSVASMTGRRGHAVAWDDPTNPEQANSVPEIEKSIRIFTETLSTRLVNPKTSAIIIIMQRLHQNDVSGYILSHDLGYEHLCLPMEFEPSRRCRTSIGFVDPRKKEGELLFPERFPQEVVDRDKKVMGSFAAAGQFQQLPAPRGGAIFHTEWWKFYTVLPEVDWRIITADTAQKTDTQHDYTVFQCWGRSHNAQAVLIDQLRGKFEAPELKMRARAFWNKHNDGSSPLRGFYVEDKVSGTGLVQELRREGMPILGIKRSIDKITRAYDVTPFVESGHVFLPEDAPWLADYLAEAELFPAGSHDDQMDPTFDAIGLILHEKKPAFQWSVGGESFAAE